MGNKLIKTYETPTDFTICVYQSEKSGRFAVTTYDCVTEKHSDVKWYATMEEAMADANSRANGYELDESKKTIRLNESQLRKIVKESVKRVLMENDGKIHI